MTFRGAFCRVICATGALTSTLIRVVDVVVNFAAVFVPSPAGRAVRGRPCVNANCYILLCREPCRTLFEISSQPFPGIVTLEQNLLVLALDRQA